MTCQSEIEGAIEYIRCDSARDFLDTLQVRNPLWLLDSLQESLWIFRGQRKAEWSLIPSALRANTTWFDEFKLLNRFAVEETLNKTEIVWQEDEYQPTMERLVELALHVSAEWFAVEEFIKFADQVGHPIPEDKRYGRGDFDIKAAIREIMTQSRMKFREYRFSPGVIEFSLVQHHGIPTRSLDWTTMPFVAAFFAAEEAIQKETEEGLNYDIAVWALHRKGVDETDLEIVTERRAKISYLHAQGGLFVYDAMANYHFVRSSEWRNFEEVIEQFQEKFEQPVLRKVIISANEAREILRLLMVENVTRAHLMPTYDNITETLLMKRRILPKG